MCAQERLDHLLGPQLNAGVSIGTFHAMCSRLFLRCVLLGVIGARAAQAGLVHVSHRHAWRTCTCRKYVHLLECGLNADFTCLDAGESRDVFAKVIQVGVLYQE
jgi:superfamily I DNA/RNA helicase